MIKAFKKAVKVFKEELKREELEFLTKEERFKFLEKEYKKNKEKMENNKHQIKYLESEIEKYKKFTKKKMIMLLKYYDFELVGSRNLNLNKEDSDYDFMITDLEKFHNFIEELFYSKDYEMSDSIKFKKDIYPQDFYNYPHLFQSDIENFNVYAPKQELCIDGVKFDICLVTEILDYEKQIELHNRKYYRQGDIL